MNDDDGDNGTYLVRIKMFKEGEMTVTYNEYYAVKYDNLLLVTKAKKAKYEAEGYTEVSFTIEAIKKE